MEELLSRVKIILVHPEDSGNIGSVCRAMKTMGMTRLSIVKKRDFNLEEIKRLSVHAFDVFESAEIVETLDEALAGTVMSAGTTRRKGKKRKHFSLLPEEFVAQVHLIESGDIGVVFGNEVHGLTDEELSLCSLSVHIPSSEVFPSLNLSHAVQVITYAFYRYRGKTSGFTPVSREHIEQLTSVIIESLSDIGFFKITGEAETRVFFSDILSRSLLSSKEAQKMERIFRKIQHLKICTQINYAEGLSTSESSSNRV
jgi:tRNA/rRNA methyltransferase